MVDENSEVNESCSVKVVIKVVHMVIKLQYVFLFL